MSWQEREPSVKINMDKTVFNVLVDILNYNSQIELPESGFADDAKRLKEKLLRYSVPKIEEDREYVDVRFFPREASDIIWQLLIMNKPKEDTEDYYSILLKNREERKKN